MCPASAERVSELPLIWGRGDQDTREELVSLAYGELRRFAPRYLCQERPDYKLQSGALVHEPYLRLHQRKPPRGLKRAHFFGVAAQLMQRIPVDPARRRLAAKLANMHPQKRRLIVLRYFGGLSIEENSVVLSILPATLKCEWATTRACPQREMKGKEARK